MYRGISRHINEWVSYGERSQEKLRQMALDLMKNSPRDDELFLDREFHRQSETRFISALDNNINEILESN